MDELERRVRAANPFPVRRGDPLSDRARRELFILLQKGVPPVDTRRSRRPARLIVSAVAVIVVVLVAVAAGTVLAPRAAIAAPPLLEGTPVAESPDRVLERLAMNARTASFAPPSTRITIETWSADLAVVGGHLSSFVQPREVMRSRTPELSGEIVVRAGAVKWGAVQSSEHPIAPGTELERSRYAAGGYPLLFPDAPPRDAAQLPAYFAALAGVGPADEAGEYFRAVMDLRNEWGFNGMQTAAVLELIRTLTGVSVAGRVTDRLGRPGIAVTTETRSGGNFRDLLIFDENTGELLSAEQVYLGGDPTIDLDSPTVLDYIAWKEPHP